MKFLNTLVLLICSLFLNAQTINFVPVITPSGGRHADNVKVECTFPEGCAAGVYWINGSEITAHRYTEPFTLDYSCKVSAAGVNEQGRIITDIVSQDFDIYRATPPYITCTPKEGVRKQSFYVTRIQWNNVTTARLHLDEFKEGGPRHGESVVWVTNASGQKVAFNDYNGIWNDGLNGFKAYIYKNYDIVRAGKYVIHIADGVFELDGKLYEDELQLNYEVRNDSNVPEFTPEEGEYVGPLQVTIDYPTDGTAFYQFYKINGGKAKQYTGPLTLTETSTIQAYGIDEDFAEQTPTASATYVITPAPEPKIPLALPIIARSGNTVTIAAEEGATVKYWMNDNMNTSQLYSAPFTVTENGKVSCVAYNDGRISPVANLQVSDFPTEQTDLGNMILKTPSGYETAHVLGMSPNGRYVAGYVGENTSSKGFIWDVASDEFQFQSTVFVNQLYGVSNDGTAYGWRTETTEIDDQVADADLYWGVCKNGIWKRQPKGFNANGITADGILLGMYGGLPVTYDFATDKINYYTLNGHASGVLTTASADGSVIGGYVIVEGKRIPAIWKDQETLTLYEAAATRYDATVRAISHNGEWAVMSEDCRVNLKTGEIEQLVSSTARYSNTHNPEILQAIADDGTIFGNYDGSLLSSGYGNAMVYTRDGRVRSLASWLLDERNYTVEGCRVYSLSAVSADAKTIIMHGKSMYQGEEDIFTVGIALRTDVKVKHLAPVGLKAEPMSGMETVKVTWKAPLTGANSVKSFTLYRNGEAIATTNGSTYVYYDKTVEVNVPYTYTLTATYGDGVVSDASYSCEAIYVSDKYSPVRNLTVRLSGLNDANLMWDAPVVSLPKLQYFKEDSEWFAFGTARYNAEFGIRIPASDIENYKGQQIRTFQFLPTGPQKSYTLSFYKGNLFGTGYNATPFYSQPIDPESLNYGTINVITLDEPQNLPNADLYIGLRIETAFNDNMLGVSYEGFRAGYTDLCRIEGVHDQMVPISGNSSETTEIVIPLGIGVCSEDTYNGSLVANYTVSDNGEAVATTSVPKVKVEDLSEGNHEFAVTAVYSDGKKSQEVKTSMLMTNNDAAYVAVDDVNVIVNDDNTACIEWAAPLEDDRTVIHWGDMTPKHGFEIPQTLHAFLAASIYPVTMTAPYADEYEITDLYYCPMADAQFGLVLDDTYGNEFVHFSTENTDDGKILMPAPEFGKINYLHLPEPVTVDPSVNYQLSVDVYAAESGSAPLAYDSSDKWKNGMSNLINYGYGLGFLSDFVQANEHPNWLIGMVIRQKDAKPMPLQGYDVRIDGVKVNAEAVTATKFVTAPVMNGEHTASIDVVYTPEKTVSGSANTFFVENNGFNGIEDITLGSSSSKNAYDLQGRRIIADKAGRGLYIIGGKKITK